MTAHTNYVVELNSHGKPEGGPSPTGGGFTPAEIQQAYGFNAIPNASTDGGAGETIAIIDAYSDPDITSDLAQFDSYFSLPSAHLTIVNQSGGSTLPAANTGWAGEISLDVEWTHAMAPGANILLVEANNASMSNLMTAVKYAGAQPGVAAVSMSWGGSESASETSYDKDFLAPGVVFISSSGDSGAPAIYPSTSPNVLAVGGTTLTASSSGAYSSESAWSDSGGGISKYESKPSYQNSDGESTTYRTAPDVSYDANPSTGFPVYQTYGNSASAPWLQYGGTSDAAPQWAALVAIADQGRAAASESALTNATLMPLLYNTSDYSSDFHDVTTGKNNKYSAGTGYDLVTGLGTPVANNLYSTLVGSTNPNTVTQFAVSETNLGSPITVGVPFSITVTAENSSGTPVNFSGTVDLITSAGTISPTSFSTFTNGVATFNITLSAAGSDLVTARDAANTSIEGSATFSVSSPYFAISGLSSETAGVAQTFTIAALLPGGAADDGYAGPISLTSTGGATFGTPSWNSSGVGTVSVTFDKTGTYTITATDSTNSSMTGTSSSILVNPGAPTQLLFTEQPANATAGSPIGTITLTEEDQYGNVVTTDSSSSIALSLESGTGLGGTLTATASKGVATFTNVTESQTGTYNLIATDSLTSGGTLTATSNSFTISSSPPPGSGNVIENFTNGLNNYYYYGYYYPRVSISSAAAHPGTATEGLVDPGDQNWYFRQDSGAVINPGDTVTAWVEFTGSLNGRAYFGFGTTANGLDSVVLAPNSNQLIVQNNAGFESFTNVAAATQTYTAKTWYEIQIQWGSTSGNVTVELLNSSGTVLNTIANAPTGDLTPGYFAFRSTTATYFSTVTDTPGVNDFTVLSTSGSSNSSTSNSGSSTQTSGSLSASNPYLWLPTIIPGSPTAQELWYLTQEQMIESEGSGFMYF